MTWFCFEIVQILLIGQQKILKCLLAWSLITFTIIKFPFRLWRGKQSNCEIRFQFSWQRKHYLRTHAIWLHKWLLRIVIHSVLCNYLCRINALWTEVDGEKYSRVTVSQGLQERPLTQHLSTCTPFSRFFNEKFVSFLPYAWDIMENDFILGH